MKPTSSLLSFLALCGSALLVVTQAQAANYYWDSNGTTAGLGDTGGTWGSSAFFRTISAGDGRGVIDGTLGSLASQNGAAADNFYFGTVNLGLGTTASTIGTTGSLNALNLVIGFGQANNVDFTAGGTLTLATSGSITVNNKNVTTTFGAALAQGGTMTKAGSGTLILTSNSNSGGTGITIRDGGTLQIGNGTTGSIVSQTLTFNNGGGVFDVRRPDTSTQSMGNLVFSAGEGTVISTAASGSATQTVTFATMSSRTAGATANFSLATNATANQNNITLTTTTNAPLSGSGSNNNGIFFGGTEFARYDTSAGYFRAVTYGTDNNAAAIVGTATTLGINNSATDVKISGAITAQDSAAVNTLNLAGNSLTFQDTASTLDVNGILSSGSSSALIANGVNASSIRATSSGGEMVIRVNGASDQLTIQPNIIAFGSSSLTKSGAGTLVLSGTNTYTGTTTINTGTLAVSGGAAILNAGNVALANTAGAIFKLNSSETISQLTGGGLYGGNVNIQGNTLTLSSSGSYAFGGQFSGTSAGGIIKQGAGTLTLSNKNSFAGSITLEGGALTFTYGNDGTGTLIPLSSGGAINMANGTTLNFAPAASATAGILSAQLQATNGGTPPFPYGWTVANDINIASGTSTANITVAGNENAVRFTGNVTGGASGNQTLSITTGNGQDREVAAFSGVLADGSSGTLGLTATLRANNNGAYVNLTNNNTFSGPISVTTTSTAPGYLVIGGERYGTGPTLVTGSGSLGTGGVYSGTISLTNTGAGVSILNYASSANQTLSGAISGTNGRLTKDGSGVLTLSNATNSYTGGSTVNDGTLVFRNTGAKSASGTHAFAAGTTLGLGVGAVSGDFGSTDITNGFAGTMTGNLSGITVTATTNVGIDTTAGNFTHAADISGNPTKGLTKLGTGTLELSGASTYTGATLVSAGTLYLTGSLSGSAVTVGADGTFRSTGALDSGLTIAAGGNLDLTGATIDLNNTNGNILSITGGTLTLGNLTFQDIVGWDWFNAAPGTYELIDGAFSVAFGSTAYLDPGTAYDFGNGKSGYFTSGSLNAVIVAVPEPRAALLGGLGVLALLRRRRS